MNAAPSITAGKPRAPLSTAALELRVLAQNGSPQPAALAEWAGRRLAALPTLITFDERAVELVVQDELTWRRAGRIIASPGDRDRFRIHLRRGATRSDLEHFERVIEQAKAGRIFDAGWEQNDAGHLVYRLVLAHPIDPFAQVVLECAEAACMASWHFAEAVDGPDAWVEHVHGEIERDGHLISVRRDSDADEWTVHLSTERGSGMTPGEVASLVNDLTWCRGDVLRLNAQRLADAVVRRG